eukprot:RCo013345
MLGTRIFGALRHGCPEQAWGALALWKQSWRGRRQLTALARDEDDERQEIEVPFAQYLDPFAQEDRPKRLSQRQTLLRSPISPLLMRTVILPEGHGRWAISGRPAWMMRNLVNCKRASPWAEALLKPDRKVISVLCTHPDEFPSNSVPEVCFAGRTNVGKSRLISSLLLKQGLAKTSPEPGFTKQVQFVHIRRGLLSLVDLPGYRYDDDPWNREKIFPPMNLMMSYVGRKNLKHLFLVIDAAAGFKPVDELMLQAFLELSPKLSFSIVMNKADQVHPATLAKQMYQLNENPFLQSLKYDIRKTLITSAATQAGLFRLRTELARQSLPPLGRRSDYLRKAYPFQEVPKFIRPHKAWMNPFYVPRKLEIQMAKKWARRKVKDLRGEFTPKQVRTILQISPKKLDRMLLNGVLEDLLTEEQVQAHKDREATRDSL